MQFLNVWIDKVILFCVCLTTDGCLRAVVAVRLNTSINISSGVRIGVVTTSSSVYSVLRNLYSLMLQSTVSKKVFSIIFIR